MEKSIKIKQKPRVLDVVSKVLIAIMLVVLIVYCISLLILPVWMILTSFKNSIEYVNNSFGWPENFYFLNYSGVFEKLQIRITDFVIYNVFHMLGFSTLYSLGSSLINVFFTTCMAYVLSKYKFFGSNFIYNLGIVVMIVPIIGSLPSAMMVRDALGVYNNMFLHIITSPSTCFSGTNFLLLYGAFKSLPWDYAEAVFIDGGNDFTAFFKMFLPMILPTATVIFVLSFLGSWNDYQTFMIWLPDTPNLAYGLYQFQGVSRQLYKATIGEIMAGFSLVIIPTVVLYSASQGLILSKFTVGGLKG
ncbi:MAG: carbohydrate ABC transporter permease [Clostridia bacterium]|nr:carbohydrate ABC transporter permease [Clostridia bacterium]